MFGLEIVILLLVVFFAAAADRGRRKRKVSDDLDVWAQRLGMVRVGQELFGQLDGVPVGARLAFDSPEGARAEARWTLYARLQPPLDLGLLVSNRMIPVELASAGYLFATSAEGGGSVFDRRFKIVCDEPQRARALLTPALRQLMLRRLHPNAMFMLTDQGVAVQTVHGGADEATLRLGLDAVAAIANSVNLAREHVPAALPLTPHRRPWARFAASNGLGSIAAPLCMFGTIEDATVYAYSVRASAGELNLEVWLRFEEPLALGLLVQPMRTLDRMKDMFGAADYKLGDALFDDTFLVRVSDEAGTVSLLDAETRKRLLVIHDTVGPLSLTDDGLSIRLPIVPQDPAVVPKTVRQLLEIAQFIADKRRGDRTGGPYR